jgi:chaperonin GroES
MAVATKVKLRITPLGDRVVIVPDSEPEAMWGRLHIPDTAKEKPTRGRVIAVGPGRFEKGARVPIDLAVGNRVLYEQFGGTVITIEGQEVVIVKATDILATLG